MMIGHCLNKEELFSRVRSSHQMSGWLAYLQLRDEEEVERMKAMYGER